MSGITASSATLDLFQRSLVWDAHSGFMPVPEADLANLKLWREAGVDYLSINVGFDLQPWHQVIRTLAAFRHYLLAHPEDFLLVERASEIAPAKASGRMVVSFDLEGANALDGRLEMVELYHRLGVRQMLLAYNRGNLASGGCHDTDSGLTAFGRQVVDEMNQVGMVLDVTHCSRKSSLEAMERSTKPVVFSHSNTRAVHPHGRNIDDDQIRACARTGGVIGVMGISLMIGDPAVGTERMADHIDHLIQVAGEDHVGIGLDYGFSVDFAGIEEILAKNPEYWPKSEGYGVEKIAYAQPRQILELAEVMARRGYAAGTIAKVLGGNFHRVAMDVWG